MSLCDPLKEVMIINNYGLLLHLPNVYLPHLSNEYQSPLGKPHLVNDHQHHRGNGH